MFKVMIAYCIVIIGETAHISADINVRSRDQCIDDTEMIK